MKKISTLSFILLITYGTFAQAPEKMSYQAVIRNSSNELVTNSPVGMKISILRGTPTGTLVYQEIYNPNPETNANGLVNINIGEGLVLSGTFSTIDWSNGPYFLKTETDPAGGTSYSITGTSELMSVPYALYAKTAENGFSGNYNDLSNKPSLATVATSGSYNDLSNKPVFPGIAHINPTSFKSWTDGTYQTQTLATLTMNIPASGWVLLIHTGYMVFFSQNRTMDAGIGTNSTTMLNSVSLGYLDGSSTLRYESAYTVTTLVAVTAGTHTFYALGAGNSTFKSGTINMTPKSFTGIYFH